MITEEEAKTILTPYHQMLYEVVIVAWKRYLREIVPQFQLPSSSFRAEAVHALMMEEARRVFFGVPGVRVLELQNRVILEVEHIWIRFKKLDKKLRTRNYPTLWAMSYDRQLNLVGYPPTAKISVGYVLNQFATGLDAIKAVYAAGSSVMWHYDLEAVSHAIAPVLRPARAEQEMEVLVRPRQTVLGEEDKGS